MKPWAKLWRRESTRFRSLPLASRAIAAYVLKFVDQEGALPLGKRDPVTAVSIAVSASPGERRWLRGAVDGLVEHGYLIVRDGLLVVGNFPRYQEDKPLRGASRVGPRIDAEPTMDEREPDVTSTRVEREPDVVPTLSRREISVSERNHSLARDVLSSERSEIGDLESERERVRAMAVGSFKVRWQLARSAMWPGTKGDPNWDLLAKFLVETAKLRNTTPEALLARKLDGWFADPYVVGAKFPTENFVKYPDKHIDEPATASSPTVSSPLEAAWQEAQQAAHRALLAGADPATLHRLEQAEEAALASLRASRRKSA